MNAVVGEDGVGSGHVERRGGVGPKSDRWGAAGFGDAGGPGQCGNILKTDLLAERDGGVVERVRQSVDGGNAAVELFLVIARGVGLASVVEGEGGGDVVEHGGGGEDA